MKLRKSGKAIAAALLVGALIIPLSACESDSPLEEAGDAIEDTAKDVGDALEDATDGG